MRDGIINTKFQRKREGAGGRSPLRVPLNLPMETSLSPRPVKQVWTCNKARICILLAKISGCVPFGESKNRFLILDLPNFAVEMNVKSEIGFVTLVTFRQRVQYARQPLKNWRVSSTVFDKLCDYTVQNLVVRSSNSDDGTYKTDKERSALKLKII